jgi:hypothetical protein
MFDFCSQNNFLHSNQQTVTQTEHAWLDSWSFSTLVLAAELAKVQISSSIGTAGESTCHLVRSELHHKEIFQ